MYLSNSEGLDNVHTDDNNQMRQEPISPPTSNPPSSHPALLVVDDNSNSDDDSSLNIAHIPLKTSSSPEETTLSEGTTTTSTTSTRTNTPSLLVVTPTTATSSSVNDSSNDTSAQQQQQRRRNSSVAKLLGGQPLKNQQYEEISQQLIDNQSTQHTGTNGDNSTDTPIQRSRSSITRNLLMNADRHMHNQAPMPLAERPSSPTFNKDFEYLIRRELDIEHSPATLHRNSSTPSIFQTMSTARNTPPASSPTPPSQSKLKRKRTTPKQIYSTPSTSNTMSTSKSVPFKIGDPFEIDSPPGSSSTSTIKNSSGFSIGSSTNSGHYHQNDLMRFDALFRQRSQAQYRLPLNIPPSTTVPINYQRTNPNNSIYSSQKKHSDRLAMLTTQSPCPTGTSSSFHPYSYPPPLDLALPLPVSSLSSHSTSLAMLTQNSSGNSSRKNKVSHIPSDFYEAPIHRFQTSLSNPGTNYNSTSSSTTSSTTSSAGTASVPLKKRLLHAYESERRPSSSL